MIRIFKKFEKRQADRILDELQELVQMIDEKEIYTGEVNNKIKIDLAIKIKSLIRGEIQMIRYAIWIPIAIIALILKFI